MEIGQKIKKMRKEAGISQEELAFALEVSRQTVTRWERGRMIPDTERVAALAKYFGVTADELMNDEKTAVAQVGSAREERTDAAAIKRRSAPKILVVLGAILIVVGLLGVLGAALLFSDGDVTAVYASASVSTGELFAIFGVLAAVGVVLTAAFAISRAVKRRKA